MVRARGTHETRNPEVKGLLGDLDVERRIILKWMLGK